MLAAGLAALAVLAVFGGRVGYDHNLLHMQANGLESVKWEQKLIDRTAGASWCALSVADSPQEALALKARYEKLPEVSRVVEVASLVPPDQDRKLDQLADIQSRLKGLPARGTLDHAVPECAAGRDPGGQFPARRARPAGPGQPAADPRAAVAEPGRVARPCGRRQRRRRPSRGWTSSASGWPATCSKTCTASATYRPRRAITLADLPPALRERFVGQSGKWLVQAYARDGLWDIGPLEHFVNANADRRSRGDRQAVRHARRTPGDAIGFARAGVYALLVIVVVLWVDFRTVGHTLLALAPLVAGAVITLGVMGLMGVPLNPANMIALPLIVGVGVDNGVHVLHDYLARRGRRSYTLAATTGKGIAVSAIDDGPRLRHADDRPAQGACRPGTGADAGRDLAAWLRRWCCCRRRCG